MHCPKCHYERKSADTAQHYECPKCGIVYAKFNPIAEAQKLALRAKLVTDRAAEGQAIPIQVPLGPSQFAALGAAMLNGFKKFFATSWGKAVMWIAILCVTLAIAGRLINSRGLALCLAICPPLFYFLFSKQPSARGKTTSCRTCRGLVAYGVKACPHCGEKKPAPKPVGKLGLTFTAVFIVFFVYGVAQTPSAPARTHTEDDSKVRAAAQVAIELAGYRCDTMDSMQQLLTKSGFTIKCNNYRYVYTVTDEGGRMVIRVD